EMRSLFRTIAITAGILVLAGVQNARAQLVNALQVTTAFPFTVGNATVPAGSYTIKPDDEDPHGLAQTRTHAPGALHDGECAAARDAFADRAGVQALRQRIRSEEHLGGGFGYRLRHGVRGR